MPFGKFLAIPLSELQQICENKYETKEKFCKLLTRATKVCALLGFVLKYKQILI